MPTTATHNQGQSWASPAGTVTGPSRPGSSHVGGDRDSASQSSPPATEVTPSTEDHGAWQPVSQGSAEECPDFSCRHEPSRTFGMAGRLRVTSAPGSGNLWRVARAAAVVVARSAEAAPSARPCVTDVAVARRSARQPAL
ncbi:hypothetical protein [Streptomyces sp. I05A-00742]|uniref:hypothetical protein n=1 Tax=Streptomyces sp. I05A-00742 TaxID=2732853 RepID=UPI001487ECEA|nr:hypothetical protein [Streptomyces sp. I05A-00742]